MSNSSPFLGRERKRFMCPECLSCFTRIDNLRRHTRLICGKSMRPYVCSVCNHQFKLKHHLKKHVIGVHLRSAFGEMEVIEFN